MRKFSWIEILEHELIQASPVLETISCGPESLVRGLHSKMAILITSQIVNNVRVKRLNKPSKSISEIAGRTFASVVVSSIMGSIFEWSYNMADDPPGKRTWFKSPAGDKRVVNQLIIVYHDADKAGKHVDVHFGDISFVVKVSGKPVESKIKFDSDGVLTKASKEALMRHVVDEVRKRSRVPQNLDHSLKDALETWFRREDGPVGYGSGATRQVVTNDIFEIMKSDRKSAKLYAPPFGKEIMYIYKLKDVEGETPIAVWGFMKHPEYEAFERLHLKMVLPEDIDKFMKNVDPGTITRKYDGASAFFVTTDSGTFLFSPRVSKTTGGMIDYTMKVPEIYRVIHKAHPQGMGEIMFKRNGIYIPASEIGGILNSNSIRPMDIIPDFRIYRIDKWNGVDVSGTAFRVNRSMQSIFASVSKFINLPEFAQASFKPDWEGVVGVPFGKSINEGMKAKWWGDESDWEVTSVELGFGPKGNIAGVVRFRDLGTGREFKLGPGQIGNRDECIRIMKLGNRMIGSVAKVRSRHGHLGRASKIKEWHMDKGTSP